MSAEVGVGILGVALVAGAIGAVIAAAVALVVVGAAVTVAVSTLSAAARGVNRLARAAHQKHIQESIQRQRRDEQNRLMKRVAEQREALLKLYTKQSGDIERASEEINRQRDALVEEAKSAGADHNLKLEQLQRRVTELNRENTRRVTETLNGLNREIDDSLNDFSIRVEKQMADFRQEADRRLDRIADRIEHDREGLRFGEQLLDEAKELYEHLKAESDVELVADKLDSLERLIGDCESLRQRGQGQALVGSAVSLSTLTMEACAALDAERHRRQLMDEQLNLSSAELRAMVEKGLTVSMGKGEKLPSDMDYWTDGRLAPVVGQARALLAKVDGHRPLRVSELERLMKEINDCTGRMNALLRDGRQAYVCSFLRMQMVKKATEAFRASGWNRISWGFVNSDFRETLIVRFANPAKAVADLMLVPLADPITGEYSIDVKIERHDPGIVDEKLRDAQLAQLSQCLKQQGLPVSNCKCVSETRGKNAMGPLQDDRFRKPSVGDSAGAR